jgi:methyl-accepting chemotaxis protein
VLKNIKASLDGISGSIRTALSHFADIDASVKTVSEQETHIRKAVEEQDAGSKEILATIARSNDITRNVRHSSESILVGSQEVIGEGKNLKFLTDGLTSGMNEVASGMGHINTSVMRVQKISGENKQNIEMLVREIMKFKVE